MGRWALKVRSIVVLRSVTGSQSLRVSRLLEGAVSVPIVGRSALRVSHLSQETAGKKNPAGKSEDRMEMADVLSRHGIDSPFLVSINLELSIPQPSFFHDMDNSETLKSVLP